MGAEGASAAEPLWRINMEEVNRRQQCAHPCLVSAVMLAALTCEKMHAVCQPDRPC